MSAPANVFRAHSHVLKSHPVRPFARTWLSPHSFTILLRSLATVQPNPNVLGDVWFNGSSVQHQAGFGGDPNKKPDERTVKLGKTLRILQERLPTLLQTPLPQEILSPQIKLHLFPSTHPHLPTVSGRVAYTAALWTSPLTWGRLPLVGNVTLTILSERMVKNPLSPASPTSSGPSYRSEKLVVRWRTNGKTKNRGTGPFYKGIGRSEPIDKITEFLGGGQGEDDQREFTGLFIFEFDEEGRIVSHTIEHVQEGGNWEKGVGARVVGLTDWLLGGMREKGGGCPSPAMCERVCSERERLVRGRRP